MTDTQTPDASVDAVSCSFCGKSQKDVRKLIAGPGVFICDECVDLCSDIISEDTDDESRPSEAQLNAAWVAMLKSRALTARSAEQNLAKLARQARAKGLDWSQIGESLGMSAEQAETRFGSEQ